MVTLQIHPFVGTEKGTEESNQEINFNIKSLEDITAISNQASNHVSNHVSNQVRQVLVAQFGSSVLKVFHKLFNHELSSTEILREFGISKQTKNKQRYIDPLFNNGWIEYTIPGNPKDRNQKYRLTESGNQIVKLIGHINHKEL